MIDVAKAFTFKTDFSTAIERYRKLFIFDPFDRSKFTIRDVLFRKRGAKLNTISFGERAIPFLIHIHSGKPRGIISNLTPVICLHSDLVLLVVCGGYLCIVPNVEPIYLTYTVVSNDILVG